MSAAAQQHGRAKNAKGAKVMPALQNFAAFATFVRQFQ
jgi:hypothetical protein